jgi:hypothetical protein
VSVLFAERLPSVGPSPEHPASAAATIKADKLSDIVWRPSNASLSVSSSSG